MSEEQEQAVVETPDDQAKPDTEAADARTDDDLENLLSQYDQGLTNATTEAPAAPEVASGESKSTPEQKPDTVSDSSEVLKRLDAMEEAREAEREAERKAEAERQFREDMADTVKKVRGDLDADFFDDGLIKGWIEAQAEDDKRLAAAWAQRGQNPKQFQRIVGELGRKFNKKFSALPDKQATEDKEAVTAAVRGASTKAPEDKPTDYKGMSDAEFRETVEKEHGFSPLI